MISKISKIRVAILGCGMMGQEHISYLNLLDDVVILYLSDPCLSSIEKAMKMCPSATAIDSDDLFSESFDLRIAQQAITSKLRSKLEMSKMKMQ